MNSSSNLQQAINEKNAQMAGMMPPEVKQLLQQKAEELAARHLETNAIKLGDTAPDFTLPNALKVAVNLAKLLTHGPVVLSFYRGAWCPYCNLEVQALQQMNHKFKELGASLVAISPQTPDHTLNFVEKAKLDFEVLSDVGNQVSRRFGLTYILDPELRPIYLSFGLDIPMHNGDDSWELPFPATYLIDRQGKVRFCFVESDYRKRAEPADLLHALQTLI